MRADGTQLDRVKDSAPSVNLLTAWTPDGQLMWQELADGNQMNYRIRDLSSGDDSRLLLGTVYGWVFLPEFSPSGKEIAVFWNRVGGPRGLYVLSWPSLVPRLLTQSTYWPVGWSADGASIIATGDGSVWSISSTSGETRRLARVSIARDDFGDVTPDGKYLVVSLVNAIGDAWLIENFDAQAGIRP
jgi:Tol biopolymer transport system component